ncbi:OmpH family outer membrane protein [Croceicoccus sp. F390]|uniref:OmpH family outer membrane protein n=1 Tax=Croceicoccus esteveae TaxID=3075597 RepID=A0ABU2ZJT7_9SPHN|nr:OmpH family outer membrane protein [Croceicoccus sp. F390]MDT0576574.1 OmpH family outer membrane protein [Croceicoccus sp. F390]
MNMMMKAAAAALIAGTAPAALLVATPATAQIVPGIAVANPDAIVVNSAAYKLAETQRQTTYKAQIDQAEQRRQALAAQLQPLYTRIQTDSQAASPNQQSLQQQAGQIQQLEQRGQAELQQLLGPVSMSRAYVLEQISEKLPQALQAAQGRKKITLILTPDSVLAADNAYNLNQDILTELDRLIPQAQLVPPAGWMPRAQREALAAQGQPQPQQPQGNAAAPGR